MRFAIAALSLVMLAPWVAIIPTPPKVQPRNEELNNRHARRRDAKRARVA